MKLLSASLMIILMGIFLYMFVTMFNSVGTCSADCQRVCNVTQECCYNACINTLCVDPKYDPEEDEIPVEQRDIPYYEGKGYVAENDLGLPPYNVPFDEQWATCDGFLLD